MEKYSAIDLFCGCGGLSEGLVQAGFGVRWAIDNNADAVKAYKMNHSGCDVSQGDIRKITAKEIKKLLAGSTLHFLAGCPPCQGFSSIRRLNKRKSVHDRRNALLLEYLRFIKVLQPLVVMMENVPGLVNYYLFKDMVRQLKRRGYHVQYEIVNVKDYGVAQRRKRLILVGSRLGPISIAAATSEKVTVRDAIGDLEPANVTQDAAHKIYARHDGRVAEMIKLLPKDGGSRKDLPERFLLNCHMKEHVGFNDVYGRLRWDDYSTTITGGCLNPSKGRFLHPEENRSITPREAALLQSFRKDYQFPTDIPKYALALLIGNALPPKFSYVQCQNVKDHLDRYLG